MPIEAANYIADLNPTYPASPDLVATIDDHARLIKQSLKNTFPNLNGAVTAKPWELMGFVPIGGIIMWSGALNAIPSGWVLCNGATNITRSDGAGTINAPDLRDRFIKGTKPDGTDHLIADGVISRTVATTAAGGHSHSGITTTAGGHSHTGAVTSVALAVSQIPYHTHSTYVAVVGGGAYANGLYVNSPATVTMQYVESGGVGGGAAHTHGIYWDGDHAHSLAINGVADHAHTVSIADIRPPYFAMAFIMKI